MFHSKMYMIKYHFIRIFSKLFFVSLTMAIFAIMIIVLN